jgi:putative Mn2+ efflux pump MntP
MSIIEITFIAIGLAMDAFAVAIACSIAIKEVSGRQIFRVTFHFGLFQAMMPVLGWCAGNRAQSYIADWDHWIAFGLLSLIGGKAILDAIKPEDETAESIDNNSQSNAGSASPIDNAVSASPRNKGIRPTIKRDPTRGLSLLLYSVATSIDALAVGVSLAAIKVDIWEPAVIIGIITMLMSAGGIMLGNKIGSHLGSKVEIAGGVILIGIGLKILIVHTLFV